MGVLRTRVDISMEPMGSNNLTSEAFGADAPVGALCSVQPFGKGGRTAAGLYVDFNILGSQK